MKGSYYSADKNNRTAAWILAICLALVFFSFHKVASDLWAAWQTDEYSHGVIIPFISALIAWHALTKAHPPVKPSWWGVVALGLSGLMLAFGILTTFEAASEYGFIVALVGLALAFMGTRAARVMAPAFIYLCFAVPLPHLVYSNLSENLQLLSSSIGVWVLDHIGVSVYQDGNIIDLGGYKLQVVEACSGLRYLFPLVSFGYLVAYLFKDRLWKRAIVFFSAIPITIGMNSLRIALIGVTVNMWGQEMAKGLLHDFEGWVVFLICALLMMVEVKLLINVGKRGHFRFEVFGLAYGRLVSGNLRPASPVMAALLLCVGLAALLGTRVIEEREQVIPQHPPFNSFPKEIGEWRGQQQTMEPDVLAGLQLSDYWLADYAGAGKQPVNFYIAYYESQHVGSAAHSPSNCIPGGGWKIVSNEVTTFTLPDGTPLTYSRLLIKKAGVAQLVYYWFDERGRDLTETYSAKWYLLLDSLQLHRTDGALIRLVTPVPPGEDAEAADKRLQGFLGLIFPSIREFVPGITLPNSSALRYKSAEPSPLSH